MEMDSYRQVFSQLHTTVDEVKLAALPKRRRGLRPRVIAAAAIIIALGVSAAAVFGHSVQELEVREGPESSREINGGDRWDPLAGKGFISLQGYADSPEKTAMEEWMRFLHTYDPDGEMLAAVGNGPTGLDEKYALYFACTQDMADALDAIAEKYGLTLHGGFSEASTDRLSELYGGFAGENRGSGYTYDDGTFQFDGRYVFSDGEEVDYQFRRSMKGVLDAVGLNAGDTESYDQWEYKTECGVPVLLALGEYKSLIFADLEDCFIAVNVLSGSETPERLEELADSFDFSVL